MRDFRFLLVNEVHLTVLNKSLRFNISDYYTEAFILFKTAVHVEAKYAI